MDRAQPWLVPCIFLLAACFSHLHQGTLAVDAIRYAGIADHILRSGDWLNLYDAHTSSPYVNKPPFLFWLLATAFAAFGFSTFVAKLPAVLFVFIACMVLWKLADELYGRTAGVCAVVLLVCTRTFSRDLVDLTFDGMSLCGALLCLRETSNLLRGRRTFADWRFWLWNTVGVLLILQSKVPYLVLVGFPVISVLVLEGKLKGLLVAKGFWISVGVVVLTVVSWLVYAGQHYLAGAFANQFVEPVTSYPSRLKNAGDWLSAILVSFAPASWFGLAGLYRLVRDGDRRDPQRKLLLLWLLPAIAVIAAVAVRPRYILVPLLPLILLGAKEVAGLLSTRGEQLLRYGMGASALLCVVLFMACGIPVHRNDPLVAAFRTDPRLLAMNPIVCVDGDRQYRSPRMAKFTEQLLALEFKRSIRVVTSNEIVKGGGLYLINNECRSRLVEIGAEFTVKQEGKGATLVVL